METKTGDHVRPGCNLIIDSEATAHDLLNEATEWLQYAHGLTELLAELVHESDTVDCGRMALGLEAISALTRMGLQCTAHAHARTSWEKRHRGVSRDSP
ncbi:hypothetical protein C8J98_1082 [Luteibacter sp. OK325]|uniref:hypothetical protein n=1 Tax=Luteibacter sp. OK325 TaxID=2135670 RepID=UPI000D3B9F90|nr:hypothetical protein [Luteibacter sp. OK325]PTR28422.1 hypothetical protein C8J98_1082 [Luteibacter sp. OK325]